MSTPTIPADIASAGLLEATDLIRRSGFFLTPDEWPQLQLNDFGLGDFRAEGLAMIDIVRVERTRVTILVLLPNQTLPEHLHPAYEGEPGKEESLRVLWGRIKIYQPGQANSANIRLPRGKDRYYTGRRETILDVGQQITLPPREPHWFQAGPEGVVTIEFQNRVDETRNIFTDPHSTGALKNISGY